MIDLTHAEQLSFAESIAIMEENDELVKLLAILPPRWLDSVRLALCVAYWIGHVKASEDRLKELDRLEAMAIAKMGH